MRIARNYWILPGIAEIQNVNAEVYELIKIVCDFMKTEISSIALKSRKRHLVVTRQFIAFFLRKNFPNLTLSQIALMMGNRDHATALYGIRQIGKLTSVDFDIRLAHDTMNEKINQHFKTA